MRQRENSKLVLHSLTSCIICLVVYMLLARPEYVGDCKKKTGWVCEKIQGVALKCKNEIFRILDPLVPILF